MNTINLLQLSKLDRNLLKGQTATVLRDLIVKGQIAPGTKITERDVAAMLGISRMPARDALMELEGQGLIVSKPGGRYVIELTQKDIENLYRIRTALEHLALEAAVQNVTPGDCQALEKTYQQLKQAIEVNDVTRFAELDMAIHESIWNLSANVQLIRLLHSIIGPIFMLISNQTGFVESYQESLELHANLIRTICAKDLKAARQALDAHMDHSLTLSMQLLA